MRVCTLALLVVACGTVPPANYPTVPPPESALQGLGEGDVIEIVIYNGSSETKATYKLDPSGTISVQHIGDVAAAERRPADIKAEIQSRLADGYLREPLVQVNIVEVNSLKLSVSGEVAKDGTIKYLPDMTIIDVIAQSGGFTPMAKRNHVKVIRYVDGTETTFKIPVAAILDGERPNFYVAAGDRVFVPERIW